MGDDVHLNEDGETADEEEEEFRQADPLSMLGSAKICVCRKGNSHGHINSTWARHQTRIRENGGEMVVHDTSWPNVSKIS